MGNCHFLSVFVFVFFTYIPWILWGNPRFDIDIVNCYTYAYANIVYMLK